MIKSQTDFATGLLFIAIGLFFSITGASLEYGTPANMGPGFLPLSVSGFLVVIGIVQLLRGVSSTGAPVAFEFKQPMIVLVAIIAFSLLLLKIGAIVAVLILMLAVAVLHKKFSLKSFLVSYVFVVGLVLVFKFILRSPIPLWIL